MRIPSRYKFGTGGKSHVRGPINIRYGWKADILQHVTVQDLGIRRAVFVHYNMVRVHRSLRVTPAMAAGVSDRLRTLNVIGGADLK